jgi:hypothetical protein
MHARAALGAGLYLGPKVSLGSVAITSSLLQPCRALQGAKLSFFWVQLSSSVVGQGVRVQATINWLRL